VLQRLARRQGILDAVVFSGGEPTLQSGLVEAIRQVKAMGFRVALHTGGSHPERLTRCLPLLEWVGFDLKAPWSRYASVTGVAESGESARKSLEHLKASGVPFELRTTLHELLLSPADLERLAETAAECGAQEWVIQPFRSQGCRDGELLTQAAPSISPFHAEVLVQARLRFPHTSIHVRGESAPMSGPSQAIRRSA
jgi:pyruvate formate lyase activating enzyme